jgi:hypothetical protein
MLGPSSRSLTHPVRLKGLPSFRSTSVSSGIVISGSKLCRPYVNDAVKLSASTLAKLSSVCYFLEKSPEAPHNAAKAIKRTIIGHSVTEKEYVSTGGPSNTHLGTDGTILCNDEDAVPTPTPGK